MANGMPRAVISAAVLVAVGGTMVAAASPGAAADAAQVARHERVSLRAAAPGALSRWSLPKVIDPTHIGNVGTISCPTARFCAAIQLNSVVTYDGRSWS